MMDIRAGIAMSIPVVMRDMFSGVFDLEKNEGTLFDMNGMSDVFFTEHGGDSLCFKKQYVEKNRVTARGPAILYTMERNPQTNIWVGTWVRPGNEGIATMVLSPIPIPLASFADHNRVLEEVGHLSPGAEVLKRWHEAEQGIRESTGRSQENGHEKPHPDWEMVCDVLQEEGIDYYEGDDGWPNTDNSPSTAYNPGNDSEGDNLPF
jgi:hypothetical protein